MVSNSSDGGGGPSQLDRPVTELTWELPDGLKIRYKHFGERRFSRDRCIHLADGLEDEFSKEMREMAETEADTITQGAITYEDEDLKLRIMAVRTWTWGLLFSIIGTFRRYADWWPHGPPAIPTCVFSVTDVLGAIVFGRLVYEPPRDLTVA